jgi:hypothetical protein
VQPAAPNQLIAAPRNTSDPLYPKQKLYLLDKIANLSAAPPEVTRKGRKTSTLGAIGAAAIS